MASQGFRVWEGDNHLLNFAVAHMFVEDLQVVIQETRAFSSRSGQFFVLIVLGGASCGFLNEYFQRCLQVRSRARLQRDIYASFLALY